jgi:hypothetical protein
MPTSVPAVASPTVTVPAPVAAPVTAAPACQPVVVAGGYQPAAVPVRAGYAPTVPFRSTWMRVPVTTYRPVVTADPITAAPVTQLQPCNAYTWQRTRTPAHLWQRRPVVAVPQANAAPCCGSQVPAATYSGATTVPYYVPQPAGSQAPLPVTPAAPAAPAAGSTPADLAPSLPAGSVGRTQLPASPPRTVQPAPQTVLQRGRAASDVVPVPDPDARRESQPVPEVRQPNVVAPPLLDPRNHTARHARQASVSAAAWPVTARTAPRSPADAQPQWDDRGWGATE